VIPSVRRLAGRLDRAWLRARRSPAAFPRLAAEALTEARLHESFGLDAFLETMWAARTLPEQLSRDERFGQPPLTLVRKPGFLIDLYFWRSPSTSLHSHGFRGAFTILQGLSLQADYRFVSSGSPPAPVRTGDLALKGVRLLAPGCVEPITTDLAHRVWHLSMPTLSLVARTTRREAQTTYWEPGLALRYGNEGILDAKRLGILRTLHWTGLLEDRALVSLLQRLSPRDALWTLQRYRTDTMDLARLERVLPDLPKLKPWRRVFLDAMRRMQAAPDLSRTENDPERLLLALLLSGVARKDLLRFLPAGEVMSTLKALLTRSALPFRLNATALEVLEGRVHGKAYAEIAGDLALRYRVSPARARTDVRACAAGLGRIGLLGSCLA